MLVLKNDVIKMFNKKGATTADILGLFLFGGIGVSIMLVALFIIVPDMGDRAKLSVTENIAEFNDNTLLFNYLRYPIGEKTMADLILEAYAKDDAEELQAETINFLDKLHSYEARVCCMEQRMTRTETIDLLYYWKPEGQCSTTVPKGHCINWQIYFDDEFFVGETNVGYTPFVRTTFIPSKETVHETVIPNYFNEEPIKFKFILK